jgi:hypothetical protein
MDRGWGVGPLGRVAPCPRRGGPFPGVLFCHGFTGNRVEPQRLFLEFARRLTRQGLAVLRFDFGGHGESEGAFQDLTLTGELQDVKAAWDHLGACPKVDASRRALLGFSLGGYMAARSAPRLEASGAKALVLWSAVDDPRRRLGLHFFGLHGEDKMRSGERASTWAAFHSVRGSSRTWTPTIGSIPGKVSGRGPIPAWREGPDRPAGVPGNLSRHPGGWERLVRGLGRAAGGTPLRPRQRPGDIVSRDGTLLIAPPGDGTRPP